MDVYKILQIYVSVVFEHLGKGKLVKLPFGFGFLRILRKLYKSDNPEDESIDWEKTMVYSDLHKEGDKRKYEAYLRNGSYFYATRWYRSKGFLRSNLGIYHLIVSKNRLLQGGDINPSVFVQGDSEKKFLKNFRHVGR